METRAQHPFRERAAVDPACRQLPRWLEAEFAEERKTLEAITDPVAKRLAQLDIDERQFNIRNNFLEKSHAI